MCALHWHIFSYNVHLIYVGLVARTNLQIRQEVNSVSVCKLISIEEGGNGLCAKQNASLQDGGKEKLLMLMHLIHASELICIGNSCQYDSYDAT